MSRDPRFFLEDIREGCVKILRYVHDLDFESFCADEKTLDAVIRNLTIIGEAVKRLPDELRRRHSEVECEPSRVCETSWCISISE